jgi:hypothetical protein
LGQAVHAFWTFQNFNFFCSSFWQNVGSFPTFGLMAIFGYFCSFLGLYELKKFIAGLLMLQIPLECVMLAGV